MPARKSAWSGRLWRIGLILMLIPTAYLALCTACLLPLKFIDPLLTCVQAQRVAEAILGPPELRFRRDQVNLGEISPNLRNAVVASEDARFWQHHGIDFVELKEIAVDAIEEGGPARGGSTITQQLLKNLFFTTHRNPLRKVAELVLAPIAEAVLGKERILELYLNNAEWAPGVYGAQAAALHHYGRGARSLSREEAARLAAILPAPLRWRPARMSKRAGAIEERMRQMGN